ncbi:MAG TPA: HAMP domain-containing sensor histidine kinase [Chitinophagaceae bacterium]|nr:HAMP domain-containing sensor histidine kinase [Chitinophagaceae bacterium]
MMRLILLFLLSIFLRQTMIAQAPAFQTRYYTTENGLPSNGIKGIEWDEPTGFLWFGTEAGVVRFNGIDFKTFTKENTPFIGSERIAFVIRNNSGSIYATDLMGNILKVNKNRLVLDWTTPLLNGGVQPALYGLIVSNEFLNYKIRYPATKSYPVFFTRILVTSDTSMLVFEKGLVLSVSMTNPKPTPLNFTNKAIKTGFRIGNAVFVVSEDDRIFRADIVSQNLQQVQIRSDGESAGFNSKGARFFWENGYKAPIVINNNTAWRLISKGTDIIAEEICNIVPDNVLIRYVQYSEEKKILFIGTDSKGLIVISRDRVETIKKKQSDINAKNSYYSQIELPGNTILTSEGDIIGRLEKTAPTPPVKGKLSYNIYTTGDSLLWYSRQINPGNYHCLCCYSYKTRQTVTYPKIETGDNFGLTSLAGKVYVATDNGLGLLQSDSLNYLARTAPGKRMGATVFNMIESSPGVLSFASCNGLINYNISTHAIDTLLSLPGYCIRSLWKYGDYLFIGTYGKGYFVYAKGKIKAMPLDKNNFLLYTHCFVTDKYGGCWISTNRGLFRASLADMIHAFENDAAKVYYHYIGRNDGMEITEMNGGCTPCALQMQNETISFPTMDGLVWVQPNQFIPALPGGDIFIDEILADNKKINPDSLATKKLSSHTQEIVLRLGFSGWSNKENLYLEYQLNDTVNWKPINTDNDAALHLYKLGSGDYKLRIRKLNGFGNNNYSYQELNFGISTPWYRQAWFFALVALSVIGAGMLYFKLRTTQYVIRQRKLEQQVFEKTKELQQKNAILEKNDAIKTRLISIISHDIITPLKFLTVAGKNLLQKKELMPEALQQETISEITNTSQELQMLSTNILNWIKYQNENRRLAKETFNVREMVDQVLGILQSLARQKKLVIENRIDASLDVYQFYEPLKILVYNLLTNAIHFTEKGSIAVDANRSNGDITISVKDDGLGMSAEQIQSLLADQVVITSVNVDNKKGHGLGYLIIKDLVKTMGASLDIESKKEAGTTVKVKMPASKNGAT